VIAIFDFRNSTLIEAKPSRYIVLPVAARDHS
jgi:hypothetical protein